MLDMFWTWQRERITQPGSIGRWVVRDIRAGNSNHLERLLRSGLPHWDAAKALLRAAHEILELRRDVGAAQRAGICHVLCQAVTPDLDGAAHALGRVADRLAVVAGQQLEYPDLHRSLFDEAVRLERLADALHELRCDLAELAVGHDENDALLYQEGMMRALSGLFRDA